MTLICYGDNVEKIKTIIKSKHLNIRIINARFIKPIDEDMVHKIFTENDKPILVYETILKTGSLGSILLTYCNEKHILRTFEHIALADHYSKQGSVQEIYDDEKIKHWESLYFSSHCTRWYGRWYITFRIGVRGGK